MAVTLRSSAPAESTKDPVLRLATIIKDQDLNDEQKEELIAYATQRFRNRRRMAIWALAALIAQASGLLLGAVFVDGFSIDDSVVDLLQWIDLSLAGIVASYYGTTAFRPSS